LLFHQRQLRRRDKKEVALLAPVELVSPCILAGEENVAPREEEAKEEEEKVGKCFEDFLLVALVVTNNRIPLQSLLAKAFLATWC
jgi:hypothetical protein